MGYSRRPAYRLESPSYSVVYGSRFRTTRFERDSSYSVWRILRGVRGPGATRDDSESDDLAHGGHLADVKRRAF
jgi:hypothetical protein